MPKNHLVNYETPAKEIIIRTNHYLPTQRMGSSRLLVFGSKELPREPDMV